jgi:hypothetical protein
MASAQAPAPRYPEGTYADVPGARPYYIDTGGSGVPVVFMHAATGSSQSWEYRIPAFTAAGYRLIAFDRRGRCRTAIVLERGLQPGSGADDLLALLDVLGLDCIHLVGTAAGAFTTLGDPEPAHVRAAGDDHAADAADHRLRRSICAATGAAVARRTDHACRDADHP